MKKLLITTILATSTIISSHAAAVTEQDRLNVIRNSIQNRFTTQLDFWYEEGDFPRCIELLKLIYKQDPTDFEAATDLGWMLGNVERYDEELATYIGFRKANPKMPDAPFPEANFYFSKKLYSKVIPLLAPSLKLKPHGNSYRILAHSYERMGLLTDSKKTWNTYLASNPTDETAKANLRRVEGKIATAGGSGKKS